MLTFAPNPGWWALPGEVTPSGDRCCWVFLVSNLSWVLSTAQWAIHNPSDLSIIPVTCLWHPVPGVASFHHAYVVLTQLVPQMLRACCDISSLSVLTMVEKHSKNKLIWNCLWIPEIIIDIWNCPEPHCRAEAEKKVFLLKVFFSPHGMCWATFSSCIS